MKILVTGSDGLIGTNILPGLAKQFEIIPATEEQWDILDSILGEEIIRAHQPDVLINLVAISYGSLLTFDRLRYQATVCASPSPNWKAGRKPSSA